jgi:hypothetical protein
VNLSPAKDKLSGGILSPSVTTIHLLTTHERPSSLNRLQLALSLEYITLMNTKYYHGPT